MKRARVVIEAIIYAVTGLLFGCIFFRQIIFSRFDLLLEDVGDARLNGVILEHWWQVMNNAVPWLSPPFFFPVQGVLGYSDALFLNALPYGFLRFLGIEFFTANQIVLFASVALGWFGTILFLRYCIKLDILPVIIGAALFVFPNSMAVVASMHTQNFAIYYVPCLAIGIYVFVKNFEKTTFAGIVAGVFVAILIPAIFYTSYYVGWFSLFFILLLSGILFGWVVRYSDGKTVWKYIIGERINYRKILPYCVLSAICFVPFLFTYIPALKLFGNRSYNEIVTMLPLLIDYVNVGSNNWLWGEALYSTFIGLSSRPMAHELIKGMPVFLLLTFLIFLFYFIRAARRYQLAVGQDTKCKIVVTGNKANYNEKLTILAAWLGLAVLLVWLLMLKIHGISLWWLVAKLIPGAGGIRAVYRFQHVLAFPIAIVVSIGLHQVINYSKEHMFLYAKNGFLLGMLLFCLLLLVEQFNTGSIANHSKHQQREMLARISPPSQQVKVFALLPAEELKKYPFEAQIDAMIIAQKYRLHTINGYSGNLPPGFDRIYNFDKPVYIIYLSRWIQRYNLKSDRLYFLDLKTGKWLSMKTVQ